MIFACRRRRPRRRRFLPVGADEWQVGWNKARCLAGLQFDRAKVSNQCQIKTPAPPGQQSTNGQGETSSKDHSNKRPREDSKTPDKKNPTRQTTCSCDAEFEGEPLFAVRTYERTRGLYCDCCYGEDGSIGYVYEIFF